MLSLRKPLSDFAARTGIGEIVVSGTSTTFVADGYSFVCVFFAFLLYHLFKFHCLMFLVQYWYKNISSLQLFLAKRENCNCTIVIVFLLS